MSVAQKIQRYRWQRERQTVQVVDGWLALAAAMLIRAVADANDVKQPERSLDALYWLIQDGEMWLEFSGANCHPLTPFCKSRTQKRSTKLCQQQN